MMRHILWTLLAWTATSNVLNFDPISLFESGTYGESSDLLVFVEKGKSLGRSPFDKTLRTLDSPGGGLKRNRDLVIASCRGCEFYDSLMDRWQLKEDDLPVAFLFPRHSEFSADGKFRLNLVGVATPLDHLVEFVQRFDAGQLRPWVRGPPAPEHDDGLVKEVVGSTFLQEVVDPDMDILVMLYAPFCGFSKKLQPIFEELGRKFAGNALFKLARIDTTQNELPPSRWVGSVEHSRVPRIYLFPKGKKTSPEVYPPEAERTSGALIAWLKERIAPEVLLGTQSEAAYVELDRREF
mmetsp:Transcript_32855/g.83152  ORF Transcript_32855/g.83152 Transcript_32855/m.83152 type:complete len:295 (-) Transcript_32855:83-967(-)